MLSSKTYMPNISQRSYRVSSSPALIIRIRLVPRDTWTTWAPFPFRNSGRGKRIGDCGWRKRTHQCCSVQFSSVQLLNCVWLFATPWSAARQASLSITNSWSPTKPMSIESVMPSNHLILCRPFSSRPRSFPASGSFQVSQLFASDGQSIGVSASASVLPMNIQDWFSLGWTGWISLQSKRLSRVFSNTTVQKHQFFCTQLSSQSNCHIHTWPLEKP